MTPADLVAVPANFPRAEVTAGGGVAVGPGGLAYRNDTLNFSFFRCDDFGAGVDPCADDIEILCSDCDMVEYSVQLVSLGATRI